MKLIGYFRSSAAFRVRIALNLEGHRGRARLAPSAQGRAGGARLCRAQSAEAGARAGARFGRGADPVARHPGISRGDASRAAAAAQGSGRPRARARAGADPDRRHPSHPEPAGDELSARQVRARPRRAPSPGRATGSRPASTPTRPRSPRTASTGAFSHGDRPTMADLCLVPQVFNAARFKVDMATLPDHPAHLRHLHEASGLRRRPARQAAGRRTVKKNVIAVVAVVALVGAAVGGGAGRGDVMRRAGSRPRSNATARPRSAGVEVGLFDRRVTLVDLKSTSARRAQRSAAGRRRASPGRSASCCAAARRSPAFALGRPAAGRAYRAEGRARWSTRRRQRLEHRLARHRGLRSRRASMPQYRRPLPVPGAGRPRRWRRSSMRRLEERNVIFSLPGTGDTYGCRVGCRRSLRARPHRRADGEQPRSHAEGRRRRRSFKIAEHRVDRPRSRRVIAALSSDKWQPGAHRRPRPCRRRQAPSASAARCWRATAISLGSVSLETVHEGDESSDRSRTRIEGFVLAPPLRGLEGLQMRLALQVDGPQGQ